MTEPRLAWVEPGVPLPDPSEALDDPPGLLAAGRDLGVARLLEAYAKGAFPWYSDDQPVLWWSPDPRMVLLTAEFHLSRSLRQRCRQMHRAGAWTVTLDAAFDEGGAAGGHPSGGGRGGPWFRPGSRRAFGACPGAASRHSAGFGGRWPEGGESAVGFSGLAMGGIFSGNRCS